MTADPTGAGLLLAEMLAIAVFIVGVGGWLLWNLIEDVRDRGDEDE